MTSKLIKRRNAYEVILQKKKIQVEEILIVDEEKEDILNSIKTSLQDMKKTITKLNDEILEIIQDEDDIAEEVIKGDDTLDAVRLLESKIDRKLCRNLDVADPSVIVRSQSSRHGLLGRSSTFSSVDADDRYDSYYCSGDVGSKSHFRNTQNFVRDHSDFQVDSQPCHSFDNGVQQQQATQSRNNNFGASRCSVSLPKVKLPIFDGDFTNWQHFWDLFGVLINGNSTLSELDKFMYLKSNLLGPPLDLIKNIPLTVLGYQDAKDLLCEKYDNIHFVKSHHFDKLMNLPFVKDSNDVIALRTFLDGLEMQLNSLKHLGVDSSHFGSFLVYNLFERLPDDICQQITRSLSSDVWLLDDMLKVLRCEVKVREKCHSTKYKTPQLYCGPTNNIPRASTSSYQMTATRSQYNNSAQFRQCVPETTPHKSSTSSLTISSNYKCIFCRGEHLPENCNQISNLELRKTFYITQIYASCVLSRDIT
jgi:hypothetical protein